MGAAFTYTTTGDSRNLDKQKSEIDRPVVFLKDKMVALPGRPGNLTKEEEAMLKQFWRMTFNVVGVETGEATPLPDSASMVNGDTSSSTGEKQKKSGFFARRKTETKAPEQEDKYGQTKEYQEALATTSPEEFRRAFWTNSKNEHPDAVVLRFLRARKWDLPKALVMMISTLQWRAKIMKIEEEIIYKGELSALQDERGSDPAVSKEGSNFLGQLRKGKSYVHGMDREGRPVTWVRVRLHHGGDQSETSIERFTVQTFETTRLLIDPPSDTGDLFFDMSGFGIANMDYTPVKFMIKCFEANYPESLGVCLIYKAPWVFQGFWKIISRLLDPVVASKIHFTNNVKDLEPWVDRSQIPQEMGGDSPYEYHYIEPREGENDLMKDTATRRKLEVERAVLGAEFERLTVQWIKGDNVNAQRQQLAAKLKEQYWKLDPYIRARTLYDRLGVLGPGGKVDWSNSTRPAPNFTPNGPPKALPEPIKAITGGIPAHMMRKEPDSDTESLASFKTGEENWEDTMNGTMSPSHPIQNGFAKSGLSTVAAAAPASPATTNSTSIGDLSSSMLNGTSSEHSQSSFTPSRNGGYTSNFMTPTKSIRSTYSDAGKLNKTSCLWTLLTFVTGTQTWNPKDASTQTMPQTIPLQRR